MTFFSPLPSKDGKKLFVVGALARGELVRYDAKSAAVRSIFVRDFRGQRQLL